FLLLVSAEPDTGPAILRNFHRCCYPALDFADVLSLPLVWRTGRALWRQRSADRWPDGRHVRFRFVRRALRWRWLLESIFPRDASPGVRDGAHCSSAHYGCDEFSRAGPSGNR